MNSNMQMFDRIRIVACLCLCLICTPAYAESKVGIIIPELRAPI